MEQLKTIFIAVTGKCNLGCLHCSVGCPGSDSQPRSDRAELSLDELKGIAGEGKRLGANKIVLSGGEPMIRPDFRDIVEIFLDRDYRIIINSNGTLLKPALADYFALYRERISFGISLDGPKEFHDKFRRKEGAFARAMSAITLLGKKGLSVEVNCTVFDENYGVCLELINLLRDTAASIRYTPYVAPSGGGRDLQEKNLDAASIQAIILTVSRLRRQGYPVFVNAPLALLDPKDALIIECGWGQSLCGINAWGDVCMCPVTSEPSLIAGNIRAHSLESIWTNATLFRQLRNVSVEDIEGVCSICVIRQYCRGGCRLNGYLLTGRLTAPNIICQKLYDAGYFPAYAVEQPTRVAMSG